jgi:DNA-binding GntR family transcriptional regulator
MKPLPEPVRADSLSRQVYGILKEALFQGKFKPGEQLPEIQVARWLNVSQATVREALVQLEQSGLVVRHKNRKTQVSVLTSQEVNDRLTMRLALEPMAAVKAAEAMSTGDLAALRKKVAAMDQAVDVTSDYQKTLADMDFHQFIWEKAGSPVVSRTLEQLTTPLFAFLKPDQPEDASSHQCLLEAMQSGKKDAIEHEVRTHIQESYKSFFNSNGHANSDPFNSGDELGLDRLQAQA